MTKRETRIVNKLKNYLSHGLCEEGYEFIEYKGISLIRRLLTERKVMYVADLDAEGKKLKISDRTMRDARKRLKANWNMDMKIPRRQFI